MMIRPQERTGVPRIRRRRGVPVLILTVVISAIFLIQSVRAADTFDIAAYKGQVVMLDFWASWCVPCRRSFPWMNDMQTKYGDDGLVIVAINVDNDLAAAQQFLTDYPANFQVRFDEEKSLVREYEVVAMPSSFLIGRDGNLVKQHLGFKVLKQDEYEAAIWAALQQESK